MGTTPDCGPHCKNPTPRQEEWHCSCANCHGKPWNRGLMKRLGIVITGIILVISGLLISPAKATINPGNYYEVTIPVNHWNYCLTSDWNPQARAGVYLWSCVGNARQGWSVINLGNGYNVLQYDQPDSVTGEYLCLDIPGDTTNYGTQFWLWPCAVNDQAQQFTGIEQNGCCDGAIYLFRNGMALDNYGGYYRDQNPIITWGYRAQNVAEWWSWPAVVLV